MLVIAPSEGVFCPSIDSGLCPRDGAERSELGGRGRRGIENEVAEPRGLDPEFPQGRWADGSKLVTQNLWADAD